MELQFLISFFVLGLLFLFLVQYLQYHRRHHLPPSPQPCLPIIGHLHLLGPLVHQSLYRVSLRYGPLFSLRFGSVPCIVASTPYFAKQLLQANELSFSSRIETTAVKRLTYESSLAFAPYGPYWRFIKKLSMNELLGTRAINHFQHLRAQEYDRLLKLLAQKAEASEAVNMTEELLKLTNNVISMMMLGEAEEASAVVREVTKIFGEFNVSDFIWLFKKLDFQGFGKRIEDLFHTFDTLVERVISKRQQMRKNRKKENGEAGCKDEGTELRDFLDILLDYMEDESSEVKIDRVHIKALIMDFFTAGTDTTSIATEWALVELMNHPKVLQKARDEIDNVVGKSRVVEEGDVANLPYIQAVIKETFRLHPPVPLVTRRCVAECKIENYIIPDNSLLFVNVWAIGRDPNYWDSPLDFRPERFLNPNERDSMGLIDVRGQHFQLLPFGSGRRMCPGVSLAMQEVPALLAAIIQCFDFQVVGSNSKGETEKLKGESYAPVALLDMDERPGLTAPRAHNLVCFPFARPSCSPLKILS